MLYFPPDDEFVQTYPLDNYVVWRDLSGKLLEIVTVDHTSINAVPLDIRDEVLAAKAKELQGDADINKVKVDIYTWIRRDHNNPKKFLVDQSVEDINIGKQDTYLEHLLPWIPCTWNRVRREVYGRGLVEDHYGGFYSMSILAEALVIAGAIASDFKWLVKPGSVLDVVAMNKSASGTYHYGHPDDVKAIETGKRNDIQFVAQLLDNYRKQLGKVFLVLSTQLRDAERVTAEENRLRAQELNKAHGGVFGNLALILQRPVAELLLRDLDVIVKGSTVEPVVMTGLDAMGRTSENEKILAAFNDLTVLNTVPEEIRARLKASDLLKTIFLGRDVDADITMTEEEFLVKQAEMAEAQAKAQAGESMIDKAEPEQLAQGLQESR